MPYNDQIQNQDLGKGFQYIKGQLQGKTPEEVEAEQAAGAPTGVLPPGSNGVMPGHPYPDAGGQTQQDAMAAQMGAANQAQAAQDPNMAAKMMAMQAAVQKFKDRAAAQQMQKLQALPSQGGRIGQSFPAEE